MSSCTLNLPALQDQFIHWEGREVGGQHLSESAQRVGMSERLSTEMVGYNKNLFRDSVGQVWVINSNQSRLAHAWNCGFLKAR